MMKQHLFPIACSATSIRLSWLFADRSRDHDDDPGGTRFIHGAKRDAIDGAIACGSGWCRTAHGQYRTAVLLARESHLRDDASDPGRRGACRPGSDADFATV